MSKTRVKFIVKGTDDIQIGYLVEDKRFKNKHKIISADNNTEYCTTLLSLLEKI